MKDICILNFNHTYEAQNFYKRENYKILDLTDLKNVSRYCEKENLQIIRERLLPYKDIKINFIDSGNFHYITYLLLERIKEDFTLVLLDHHTDMQKPMFEELISCGSWVRKALEDNKYLKKVILIGAKRELQSYTDKKYLDKIVYISEDDINKSDFNRDILFKNINYPVYISIDKDVINKNESITDWDQGNLTLRQLKEIYLMIKNIQTLLGIDICGDCSTFGLLDSHTNHINDMANRNILNIIEEYEEIEVTS